jgi:hypothetical protein
MSGVNGNVIMSGYGDDNPDDDAPLGSDYSVWSLLDRCADAILLAVSSHGP